MTGKCIQSSMDGKGDGDDEGAERDGGKRRWRPCSLGSACGVTVAVMVMWPREGSFMGMVRY